MTSRSLWGGGGLIGQSASIRHVAVQAGLVAAHESEALLTGEIGTGKLAVARSVHARGPRRQGPLVVVDCAALPQRLVESALFGHEPGAFLGAVSSQRGELERAEGGILFLHALDRLPATVQGKLLHALRTGETRRLGATRKCSFDVQVIVATQDRLDHAVSSGVLRRDLYDRLRETLIELPPLRQRREDIPLLVWHAARYFAQRLGLPITTVSQVTMQALVNYDWPGNVWELEQIVGRGVLVSEQSRLTVARSWLAGATSTAEPVASTASERLDEVERAHIESVLWRCDGRIKGEGGAAERLGFNPSTLYSRLKKLGISAANFKARRLP